MKSYKEVLEYMKNHQSYEYAAKVVSGANSHDYYVIKACQEFLNDLHDPNSSYYMDIEQVESINKLLKSINFGSGSLMGKPIYENLEGYQWFFIVNMLGWKHKNNADKRRYEKSVLLIKQETDEPFIIGLLFIILLLIDSDYSEFCSVVPNDILLNKIKKVQSDILSESPIINQHFKTSQGKLICTLTNSKFKPIIYNENIMDGFRFNAFCIAAAGLLSSRKPINLMESTQLSIKNKINILTSTIQPSMGNVMTKEIEYAKKVLNGEVNDSKLFSLIYKT